MRISKHALAFWLAITCSNFFRFGLAAMALDPNPSTKQTHIPDGKAWRSVDPSERISILEFLITQTQGNYEKIRTFQASYLVHSMDYQSPDQVQAAFGTRIPKDSTPGLIRDFERTSVVAIDMESGSFFCQLDTKRFRLLTTDTRKPVIIPDVRPIDNRSIVTSEDYRYFDPKATPATHKVVANQPKGQNKRYARRVPAEEARNKEYGGLIDPRTFYRCSASQESWNELQLYLSTLKGDKGPVQKRKVGRLEFDQADVDSGTWYRLKLPISSRDGRTVTFTSVWSPLAGFNPVSLSISDGEVNTGKKTWKWTKIDEIYVPAVIHEVHHPKGTPDGVEKFDRTVTQTKCILNKPISPDQFDYAALGLKSGDLILDDIEQTAYIMDDSGQPKRLAAYNEEYVPEPIRARRWNLRLVIGSISAVLAIALAVISLIRVVRRTRRSHGST